MISRPVQADIGFFTKSPGLVDEEAVAPEDVDVLGLADEMRLVRHDDRHQPAGFGEGDQAALAGHVAGEVPDDAEEGRDRAGSW